MCSCVAVEPTLGKKPVMKLDVLPQGSVLDRVKAFLPEMAAANDQLQQAMADKPAGQFDIEEVDDEAEKYIEMDLSCGVVDLKDDSAVLAAERAIAAGGGAGPMHAEDDASSDSDSDSADGGDLLPSRQAEQSQDAIQSHSAGRGQGNPVNVIRDSAPENTAAGKRAAGKAQGKIIELS